MHILLNEGFLYKVFFYSSSISVALLLMYSIYFHYKLKIIKNKEREDVAMDTDLLQYPQKDIVKPIIPKSFSVVGIFAFFFIFGITGFALHSSGLKMQHILLISFFLGFAAEVAASMIKYALEVQKREDIIFVPKAISLEGIVSKDIPASQQGEGCVRLIMNRAVTQIRAKSVDEVVLTKATKVKVLYADSDRVVVVERIIDK